MPTYKIQGKDPRGKKHTLTIRASSEAKARQAAADILSGRENVGKSKQVG